MKKKWMIMFRHNVIFISCILLGCLIVMGVTSYSQGAKPETPQSFHLNQQSSEIIRKAPDITVYGLDFKQIFNRIISTRVGGVTTESKEPPLIIWLIDNTYYLKQQKYQEIFIDALMNAVLKYRVCPVALVKFGREPKIVLEPTCNATAVAQAINDIFRVTDDNPKNYCEAIQACVEAFKNYPYKKHLVIFTLQNNQENNGLENTLSLLKNQHMSLDVISGGTIFIRFMTP